MYLESRLEAYKAQIHGSDPTFSVFDPSFIPYQKQCIDDVKHRYDYSLGNHVVLLSGSVGSAKSILMAHLAVRHCIEYEGAVCLIGRKSLPQLKETIFRKILDHLDGTFIRNVDFWVNESTASIKFRNGSRIISGSWSDRKYKKFRSFELSMAIIEELTENDEDDYEAFKEIRMRLGRIRHIAPHENLLICATNPDSPGHWAYEQIIKKAETSPNFHIYYSVTRDNPFLPAEYIASLEDDMDPKEAQRMLYGRWIEIASEVIYHTYDSDIHYINAPFDLRYGDTINLCWDFNVALGKPLSICMFVWDGFAFHFFNELTIEGADTHQMCEELAHRGLLDHENHYIINGDATGRRKTSNNLRSDYDIISKFMSNYVTREGRSLSWVLGVPKSNPTIKERHNRVRAYQRSASNKTRMYVYKDCPMLNKGFKLTALKKGSQYIEDDSKDYQHITTAAGYGVCWQHNQLKGRASGLRRANIR